VPAPVIALSLLMRFRSRQDNLFFCANAGGDAATIRRARPETGQLSKGVNEASALDGGPESGGYPVCAAIEPEVR
jgi:hypothetical protein